MPGNHESAGKRKTGKIRKGNPYLKSAFVEAAWAAVHADSRLKAATNDCCAASAAPATRSP